MKFPPFALTTPESVEEAVRAIADAGEAGKFLAGGQSLLPMMAFRLAQPSVLVDLSRLADLGHIEVDPTGLHLGAMVTHRQVETSDLPGEFAALIDGMRVLGHVAIRNRGTVGGSLAHCDPSAEWPALLALFDGVVEATSSRGVRAIEGRDFAQGWFTSALEPDEMVTRITFPSLGALSASALCELTVRAGDFAMCGVAIRMSLPGGATAAPVRVVSFGLSDRAVTMAAVADVLARDGLEATQARIGQAVIADLESAGTLRLDDPKWRYCAQSAVPELVRQADALARDRLVAQ